jgi:WD40 repeat protein
MTLRCCSYLDWKLWDTRDRKLIESFDGHRSDVTGIAINNKGTGRVADVLFLMSSCVNAVLIRFSVIVSCSFDNTICLFDTAGRGHMRQLTLLGHTDAVVTLCLSARSEIIVSSGSDCSIRVWDVATGACVKIVWTKVSSSNSASTTPNL